MKLVTATAFLMAAAALNLRSLTSVLANRAALLLAVGLIALAILSLTQEFSGRDLLIDTMWIAEPDGAAETVHPGRMAANTAAGFVAVGTALLLARRRSRATSMIARLCLLVVLVIVVEVLIGYLFAARPFRSSASATPMALPTAINFALLAYGLARQRGDEWPMAMIGSDSASGAAARSLLPAAAVISVATGLLRLWGQQRGLYGTETGTALYAVANVMALSAVTLYATSRLHRIELARNRDRANLRDALAAQDMISATTRERAVIEQVIVERCRSLAGAAGAVMAAVENGQVFYRAPDGSAAVLEGLDVPRNRSLVSSSLVDGRVHIIEHLSGDQRVEAEVRERMGDVSAAIVPLRDGEILLGSIVVFGAHATPIERERLDLLRIVADASAAALAQAEQFEARQRLLDEKAGELEMLQEQFLAFMTNIPAAAFIKDEEGRYVYANPGVRGFLGRDPPAILGSVDDEVLPAARARSFRENEALVLETGRTADEIVRFDEGATESSWLLFRFPIRAGGRRFLGGVAIDVTEQRRAEEKIVQLNSTLELRVAARTAQLEEINAELEAFTYSVSHDLRAPLRAVNGYGRILEEDHLASLDDEARRYLAVIRSEAQRMGTLIDHLLAFSRIGRQSLSPKEMDINAVVRDVVQELRREWSDRPIEVSYGDLPDSLGDHNLIRQVLVNLLSNAVKYAKKDAPARIEITAISDEAFNTYRIRDYGVGFDMTYADKLFGVFQRLHSSDEFEGTGVGLAIVERIIRRHGGRVWADSTVGEGATFFFTLPAPGSDILDETPADDLVTVIPHVGALEDSLR